MHLHRLLGSGLILTSVLVSQTGTVTEFGTPCFRDAFDVPSLEVLGTPQVGSTLEIAFDGPNFHVGLAACGPRLVLGFTPPNPIQIPVDLGVSQPAGCALWVTPDAVFDPPFVFSLLGFEDHVELAVPSSPSLVGLTFHVQWVVQCLRLSAPIALSSLEVSEAATITIGS